MSMKIGIHAWIDFAFRKIFGKPGNEICLISLLNAVLQLPHPVVSVEYLNPFGYRDFETDKLICVDVKATDECGRVFVIEVQIVVQSSFAKRAVFYACEAYTDQLRAGQGYSDLKATYSMQNRSRFTRSSLPSTMECQVRFAVQASWSNGPTGSRMRANTRSKSYEGYCLDWSFFGRLVN